MCRGTVDAADRHRHEPRAEVCRKRLEHESALSAAEDETEHGQDHDPQPESEMKDLRRQHVLPGGKDPSAEDEDGTQHDHQLGRYQLQNSGERSECMHSQLGQCETSIAAISARSSRSRAPTRTTGRDPWRRRPRSTIDTTNARTRKYRRTLNSPRFWPLALK